MYLIINSYQQSVTVERNTYECHETLLRSFVMLFFGLFQHSLIHWQEQCVIGHHLPKCLSYHEAIGRLVITRKVHFLSFWLHICYTHHYTSAGFEQEYLQGFSQTFFYSIQYLFEFSGLCPEKIIYPIPQTCYPSC